MQELESYQKRHIFQHRFAANGHVNDAATRPTDRCVRNVRAVRRKANDTYRSIRVADDCAMLMAIFDVFGGAPPRDRQRKRAIRVRRVHLDIG